MSIILIDGFDMYNGTGANTGLGGAWSLDGQGPSMVAGRFGGQALENSFFGGNAGGQKRALPSTVSQCAIGGAFQLLNIPGAGAQQAAGEWVLMNGGTYLFGVRPNSNAGLDAFRMTGDTAGTLLGSTANNLITANQWNYIEIEVVLSATVGRVTIYLNSAQVLNLTAQNISNGAVVTADTFRLAHWGNGFSILHDDLYITDTAAKLGECRVETLRPAGDNTKVFTPDSGTTNYNRVNETLVDGDTSYVQAAAVGNRDLYSIAALSSTPANIFAVNVVAFARKTDATARQLNNSVKSGTTDSDGAALTLPSGYGRLDRIIASDPNTSAAWSPPAVNALLIGPKVAS